MPKKPRNRKPELESTSQLFYVEPRFRGSSPDVAKLRGVTELTPETPGARLGMALHYYRPEAYATRHDRDHACGPTAHEDIRYFPARRKTLVGAGNLWDSVSCGYTIDHPRFEEIFSPLFDEALRSLIGDVIRAPRHSKGEIAAQVLTIARVRYTIAAIVKGEWLSFDVSGFSLFEQVERDLVERTIEFLNGRLILCLSPSLLNAKRH